MLIFVRVLLEHSWGNLFSNSIQVKKSINFKYMIGCTTMNYIMHASYEGIHLIRFYRRDKESITSLKRYKTLQGRWFESCNWSEKSEGDSEGRMVEHGVHVTLQVRAGMGNSGGSKVESFFATSTSTKGHNKWYMCEM